MSNSTMAVLDKKEGGCLSIYSSVAMKDIAKENKTVTEDDYRCPHCGRMFHIKKNGSDHANAIHEMKCNRCGYEWNSRTDVPIKCPKCGSYAWNKPSRKCECKMCHYTWVSRKSGGPSKCPNCKSNRWDIGPQKSEKQLSKNHGDTGSVHIMELYERGEGCIHIASVLNQPLFKVMGVIVKERKSKVMPRL